MRTIAFLAVLGVVLGAGWLVGRAVGPVDEPVAGHGAGHGGGHYQLLLEETDLEPGTRELAFRVERDGAPVTDYEVAHEKQLHLIVVRSDFQGFQHLHPSLADGVWRTPVDLQPGDWKVYADFTPKGADPQVLSAGIDVPGNAVDAGTEDDDPRVTEVGDYVVELRGDLAPGGTTVLTPYITYRDGREVTDLEPYLGALGHLVALRHETYDYLHVHPEGLDFHTTVEEPGTYELYLQFQHRGTVHTAQFRLPAGAATPQEGADHGDDHAH